MQMAKHSVSVLRLIVVQQFGVSVINHEFNVTANVQCACVVCTLTGVSNIS